MPTITSESATAKQESDSEDIDYVPEENVSDSDNSEERNAKRPRTGHEGTPHTQEGPTISKNERQALWATFQASVSTPTPTTPGSGPERMVKIEKRHRFAGEDVVEVVEVPEDSKDAKSWPHWKPPEIAENVALFNSNEGSNASTPPAGGLPPAPASSSAITSELAVKRRPGRRKPKVQLAELPSTDSRKGKKTLTTLEKSTLDWNAHINVPGEPELVAELEANRRGGGYLEKVEFLQRVDERKNQAFEAGRDHKRRRG